MQFADSFDQTVFENGPPAVFTLNPDGEFRLDLIRSREATERTPAPHPGGVCFCVFKDRATGWPQLVVTTSPAFAQDHPRADIKCFESVEQAQGHVSWSQNRRFRST